MEKLKFTKGTWINGYGNGLTGPTTPNYPNPTADEMRKYIPVSFNKQTIAIVIQPENDSIEEMEANAKLITAAPKLLECLNELTNCIQGMSNGLVVLTIPIELSQKIGETIQKAMS